jgi:CheY-like chemotaxis protein
MSIVNPIVVIDDDDDDHYLMKRACEKIGITADLLFFSEGNAALEYLRSTHTKPFIILCDVNMPMMNGLELRKKINEDVTLKQKSTPFIFFSTAAMPTVVRDAFNMDVQGFFIKEQSWEKMERTLRIIFEYWEKCEHVIF